MARGGVWEGGGRKRALKALEKWLLALKASPGGLGKSRSSKRLQETQSGKEAKVRRTPRDEGRKQRTLEKWFQKEGQGSEDSPRTLEKKEPALEDPEPTGRRSEKFGTSQPPRDR